jgi:putative tryptophan/tyrosine transport system substrate-binding protein
VRLVDKVLRGANPADTPVEAIDEFDFVVNLKAARLLGITFPQSLLLRATRVIE